MKLLAILLFALLLAPTVSYSQTVVKNPSAVAFTPSADHAAATAYEFDIIAVPTNAVVQTITVLKANLIPDTTTPGDVRAALNLQPVAFGNYIIRARTVAGGSKSENSNATEVWERAPGPPSRLRTAHHIDRFTPLEFQS